MLAALPPVTVPRPVARVRPLPLAIGTLAAATALIHLALGAMTTEAERATEARHPPSRLGHRG
jgi:hypothetical protein